MCGVFPFCAFQLGLQVPHGTKSTFEVSDGVGIAIRIQRFAERC